MRYLLPLLLLCGCLTTRPQPACDQVVGQGVRVRVEAGTDLSCGDALGLTERSLAIIRGAGLAEPRDWEVVFTWRFPSASVMENGRPAWGMTNARTRVSTVRVSYMPEMSSPPGAVFHELLHASEAMEGRADAEHSSWCRRGLAGLEITATGQLAYRCH